MKSIIFYISLFLLSNSLVAQNKLNGEIKDTIGGPLVGATIIVKGTNFYAVADVNGKFSISVPNALPYTLFISYVGFKSQEIQITKISEESIQIFLLEDGLLPELVITSRRRKETAQEVPIPISVVGGNTIEEAGAFNVNRVKELVPSVQLYSSNPRNTTLNIRGMGSTFGLTNDGVDPGVGFYVDGVYYARPAATALDFIDVEQIEVLRGPQGTLFGKNTTAGAFNITTRKPSFDPSAKFEFSFGNYGYLQAKASVTGAISKKIAGRLSISGTQRDGLIENIVTGRSVNDLNNQGARAQLLFSPNSNIDIILSGDYTRQRPDGYAQVIAGVVTTQRAAYRQFNAIIADLGYSLPSLNAFDRKIDHNTTWRSGNDLGGVSLNIEARIGKGTLTSTTAWRFWNWDPSNDRDFTALPVLTLSQATSKHQQLSQEVRFAGKFHERLSGVIGIYGIVQELKSAPYHIEESGSAQWRFSQNSTSALWQTPGLFEGYGIKTTSSLNTLSAAVFAQLDWEIINHLHILPGIRFNYDQKEVDFSRVTYGGLSTTDPALIALKNAVYSNQEFTAEASDDNLSGQITLSYKPIKQINAFATYSTSFKPVGVNLGGLPTNAGETLLDLAIIKPEYVSHFEVGIKTSPTKNSTVNVTYFNTDIKDYQTQVQTAQLGVNRGYLANAEKVNVWGIELDANAAFTKNITAYGSVAYTEGKYVSFTNAPVPLEETGAPISFKDISGGDLPGISKWAGSVGVDYSFIGKFLKKSGKYFLAIDSYYRSSFSSSPSPSKFLNIDGYALLNGRVGFRATEALSFSIWARNILDNNYYEQLLPAAGNAGHYAAVLGDQRTFGITIRQTF